MVDSQNLMDCSFYHPQPLLKISSIFVNNFLRDPANRQTCKTKLAKMLLPPKPCFGGGSNSKILAAL